MGIGRTPISSTRHTKSHIVTKISQSIKHTVVSIQVAQLPSITRVPVGPCESDEIPPARENITSKGKSRLEFNKNNCKREMGRVSGTATAGVNPVAAACKHRHDNGDATAYVDARCTEELTPVLAITGSFSRLLWSHHGHDMSIDA